MRFCVLVTSIVFAFVVPAQAEGVSVMGPDDTPHPQVAPLVAERNAAAAAGNLVLAREIESRIQAVYQELHPLPSADLRYDVHHGSSPFPGGDAADVVIDTLRFLATSADYELGGTMWTVAFSQQDTVGWIYYSLDHGETWTQDGGFSTNPRRQLTPLGCVVGQGDSLFVYCFFIHPADAGDLILARWNPRVREMVFSSVLAGQDTVTDFAVCRDYVGDGYWLYAMTANELGSDGLNDLVLRSTDYGLTWAVLDSMRYVQNPHLSAGAGSWMFASFEFGLEVPGAYAVFANSWFWSPDSTPWRVAFTPDTFPVHDVVVAPSFTEPADSATLWVVYAYDRENTGDWNIKYRWTPAYAPNWSDTLVLAGHPDYNEYFPDIRNYTFAGNAWMNVCYITEGPLFRAVQRRHAHATSPTEWSEPLTLNETSAGTGSDVKPRLCYSPDAGPGAGAVFTGAGLTGLYWNAPWRTGIAEAGLRRPVPGRDQTICRGTLMLSGSGGAALFDMSGRTAMELRPGVNDVSGLAPGVYFTRQTSSVMRDASSVSKVMIAR